MPPKDKNRRRARHSLVEKIERRQRQKQEARCAQDRTVWFGLGTFGLVGWSVTVPTLIGIAAGLWVDSHFPSRFSWTLMLLVLGVTLGCLNAWRWVTRESGARDEDETKIED